MLKIVCQFVSLDDATLAYKKVNDAIGNVDTIKLEPIQSPTKQKLDIQGKTLTRTIYTFPIYIHSTDSNDISVDKTITINGGLLNIMNGKKQVWAFS